MSQQIYNFGIKLTVTACKTILGFSEFSLFTKDLRQSFGPVLLSFTLSHMSMICPQSSPVFFSLVARSEKYYTRLQNTEIYPTMAPQYVKWPVPSPNYIRNHLTHNLLKTCIVLICHCSCLNPLLYYELGHKHFCILVYLVCQKV